MSNEKHYYVYIRTNPSRTLYTGITNNLRRSLTNISESWFQIHRQIQRQSSRLFRGL